MHCKKILYLRTNIATFPYVGMQNGRMTNTKNNIQEHKRNEERVANVSLF